MKKVFVLDTNVLLLDPNSLFSFVDNDVVIPLVVLEELDNHKNRQDNVGRNARETQRKLGEHKDLIKGVKLAETGGSLKIFVAEADLALLPHDLRNDKPDNLILSACLQIMKTSEVPVRLVTNDLMLRIKADALKIVCEEYKHFNVVDSIQDLYSGVKCFNNISQEWMQEFFNKGSAPLPDEIKNEEIFPNEILVIKNHEGQSAVICRFINKNENLIKLRDYEAYGLKPKNKEQNFALSLLLDEKVKLVTLSGKAGCGKTIISIAAGLQQIISEKKYKRMIVCRPVQPLGNDIGFLPGTKEEKLDPYLSAIKDNIVNLLSGGKKRKADKDNLQFFIDEGIIEIEAITYIRGRSISDAYILIDECQNLSAPEIKAIVSRVGENTKIILTGDIEQIDKSDLSPISNGLSVAVERFKESTLAAHITLLRGERSALATEASNRL